MNRPTPDQDHGGRRSVYGHVHGELGMLFELPAVAVAREELGAISQPRTPKQLVRL